MKTNQLFSMFTAFALCLSGAISISGCQNNSGCGINSEPAKSETVSVRADNAGCVTLSGMKFFAYHGCTEAERKAGNTFIVDISFVYDMSAACGSDSIGDAVDYHDICRIVSEEMAVPSNLLEHVASRILKRIKSECPAVSQTTITVSKTNPPDCFGAEVSSATLTL